MRQLFFAYMAGIIQEQGAMVFGKFVKDIGGFFDASIANLVDRMVVEAASPPVTAASRTVDNQASHAAENVPLVKNNVQLLNETAQRYGYVVEYVTESEGEDHHPTWKVTVRGSISILRPT